MSFRLLRIVGIGVSLLHCGGRTDMASQEQVQEEMGSSGGRASGDDSASGGRTAGTGGATSPSTGSPGDDSGRPLEACKSGKSPGAGSCDWLAEDLCYPTKEAACDCICPRDRDSVCLSGFYQGPDQKTQVFCR